jgi:hypothetical protein
MNDFPQFALGVLGTLALALFLVLCSASALQAWQNIHNQQLRSMSVDSRPIAGPIAGETARGVSSYWSGRS